MAVKTSEHRKLSTHIKKIGKNEQRCGLKGE